MRTGKLLLRGVIAVALGVGLALPAPPAASAAASGAASAAASGAEAGAASARAQVAEGVDYGKLIDILLAAAEMGRDGVYTPQEINQLIQQVIGAVNGTRVDLLARLNSQLTHEIQAKTEAAVTKVELLQVPWAAGPALNSTHDAAYAAKVHLQTVRDDDDALDAVGRAMITLFTMLETAYLMVDADDGTNLAATQRPYFRQGLEYLIQAMTPDCVDGGVPNAGLYTYTCSYGGKTVRGTYWEGTDTFRIDDDPPLPGPFNRQLVADVLMYDTAQRLAKRALQVLIDRGVGLP
ncbi:hypothetical protein [Micromonospora sp. WMMD1082]|uniref:hypothetical protein n=1 Tax=Micromonospora sp. WMMD1082 TaxID=3016104 RepID=UPI0024163EB5|nr:hypothetical protein [Micromonospora sp. WMMD1082]MDG4798583.1 hypothetical protein [Micromonospora sp. WMMD1082]